MWKAVVILGLAVAALALPLDDTVHEQVFRIGAVGLSFADVKGYFEPITPATAKGVPTYEFKSTAAGPAAVETDFVNFRCSHLSDFVVTPKELNTPLLLCHSNAFEKADAPAAEKMYFLISSMNLPVTPDVNEIHLTFGKNLWKSLIASHPGAAYTDAMSGLGGVTKAFEHSRMARWVFIPG